MSIINGFIRRDKEKRKGAKNFILKDGKAYCLAHDGDRAPICGSYFCGNNDPVIRFREGGDLRLRKIALKLGTIPI
jgi:hypothetical protein